ncbi:MAG: hypothetical protein AAGG48_00025 [Planctomycetota bacterium]
MDITISGETQKRLESLLASGRFNTPEEFIKRALDVLGDDATENIEQGRKDIQEGRYTTILDSDELSKFFQKKKAQRQHN